MSLNKVKVARSKLAWFSKLKGKIASLQLKLKKVKSEKLAILEDWQTNGQELVLEIESKENKMKEIVTKHNSVMEKLRENIECPVCMEIPRSGPVFVCPNGHFVCKKCKTGSCPTCRDEMGNVKSLLAVTVIENVKHKCKFMECEELFAKEKVEVHEKVCQHRIVKCPYSSCAEEVALSKLLEHFGKQSCCSNSEPIVIGTSSKTGKASYSFNASLALLTNDLSWKISIFSYKDTKFAICARKLGEFYYMTMIMFESKEVCSKFKMEMEVHELGSSREDSDLSIRYRGNPCSIDEEKLQVKYFGLIVHHKVMEKIIFGNKDHSFTVSFSFSEKRGREPDDCS